MTMASNDNNDDISADDVFRRDYAAALGTALREAEDAAATAEQSSRSQQELAEETYRLLSHDHPVGFTEQGCRALTKALLTSLSDSSSRNDNDNYNYALSDSLVEGIRQVSYRRTAAKNNNTDPENNEQQQQHPSNSNTTGEEGDIQETDNFESSTSLTGNIDHSEDSASSSSDFAALAWTVYGRIPLLCCLSNQLEEASSFLGSYRGPTVDTSALESQDVAEEEHANNPSHGEGGDETNPPPPPPPAGNLDHNGDHDNDAPPDPAPPTLMMNGNGIANGHAPAPNDGDDPSEVWASESDPSDFDFESDWNPEQNARELDAWAAAVENQANPLVQSAVPPNTQWTDVARAVTNLVHELNYTKISGLSMADWKRLKISDYLTQLVVALLLISAQETTAATLAAPPAQDGNTRRNNQYPLFNERAVHHWQQLALQPLHVFRDAVLSAKNEGSKDDFILKDYLQLLQTLLQVEYKSKGGGGSSKAANPTLETLSLSQSTVAPATWIGLSALSTLCSNCINNDISNSASRQRTIEILRMAVLEASDDLCHILEQSAAGCSEAMTDAIPWTYLSLFQIFATATINIGSTASATSVGSSPLPPVSNAQVQILLNSGLFRQWLLIWWKLRNEAENSSVHDAVLQSLFDLCCTAPSLLGKYAWRFPGLAAYATTASEAEASSETQPRLLHRSQNLRSCFLWNLLGIRLADETSGGSSSSVKWKSSSKTATSSTVAVGPTAAQAQQRAWESFQQLCMNVSPILLKWKERRSVNDAKQKTLQEQQINEISLLRLVEEDIQRLAEFNAVIGSLSNPTLQPLFMEKLVPSSAKTEGASDGVTMILDLVIPIQQELATWSLSVEVSKTERGGKVKADDDDDADAPDDETDDHEAISPLRAMRRRLQMEESSVIAVRKSVKVLKSILESSTLTTPSSGFSSKAD